VPFGKLLKRLPPHAVVAASAWASKVIAASSQLLSVRILINALGVDLYAAFSLLVGISGWFMLVDLGIGPSLQNFVSERRVSGESYSGVIVAGGICVFLALGVAAVALACAAPALGSFLLESSPLSDQERSRAILASGLSFLGAGTGGVAYRIWFGEDRGYLSNIAPAVSTVAGLVAVWALSVADPHPALFVCMALWGLPTAVIPLAALAIKCSHHYRLVGLPRRSDYRAVFARSTRFSMLALMFALTLQVDYIVMARTTSLDQIAQYNMVTKAFTLIYFIHGSILSSLWPTFTKLFTGGEGHLIRRYLFRCVFIGSFIISAGIISLIFLRNLVSIVLSGGNIPVFAGVVCVIGIYFIIRVWADTFVTVMMSVNRFSDMLWLLPIQAAISISAQAYLGSRYGIYGIAIGLSLSYILTISWVIPLQIWRLRLLR
jgi:O-antigen/teichoic acid export membrane protein